MTHRSSGGSLFSSLSFSTSVLLHFVGEFEGRRFDLSPLGRGLPTLVGGVGSILDWILGGHGIKTKTGVVAVMNR